MGEDEVTEPIGNSLAVMVKVMLLVVSSTIDVESDFSRRV